MKNAHLLKSITLLSLLVITSLFSLGQSGFPSNPTQGNANTNNVVLGAWEARKGITTAQYVDTTAANADTHVKNKANIIIGTSGNILWQRNASATQWIRISGNGTAINVVSYSKNISGDSTVLVLSDGTRYAAKDSTDGGGGSADTTVAKFPLYVKSTVGEKDSLGVYGVDSSFQNFTVRGDSLIAYRFNGDSSSYALNALGYIPIIGTNGTSGPVTGDIEIDASSNRKIFAGNADLLFDDELSIKLRNTNGDDQISVNVGSSQVDLIATNSTSGFTSNLSINSALMEISSTNPSSRGLAGAQDFTPNITPLDYIQKIGVDKYADSLRDEMWKLGGNTISDPAAQFLGTLNDQPINIKIDNASAGIVSKSNTGLGYGVFSAADPSFNRNTAIGRDALNELTTGTSNTALGQASGENLIDGSNNIFIGATTTSNSSIQKSIAIGDGAIVDVDFQMALPNTLTNIKAVGLGTPMAGNVLTDVNGDGIFTAVPPATSSQNDSLIITPNSFAGLGLTDVQKIQRALDSSISQHKKLLIPYNVERGSKFWMIDTAILLRSNSYIVIQNAVLKLTDSARDNIFRTANCGLGITNPGLNPYQNITIMGVGEATLEGADNPRSTGDNGKTLTLTPSFGVNNSYGTDAGIAGRLQTGDWRNHGVIIAYTTNVVFSNIKLAYMHAYGVSFERCENVRVLNPVAKMPGHAAGSTTRYIKNNGAIDFNQSIKDIYVNNGSGISADDYVAMNIVNVTTGIFGAGQAGSGHASGDTSSSTIDSTINAEITNIKASVYDNVVRVLVPPNGCKAMNINISNITNTVSPSDLFYTLQGAGANSSVVIIGSTNPVYGGLNPFGQISKLTINNIKSEYTKYGVWVQTTLSESFISEVYKGASNYTSIPAIYGDTPLVRFREVVQLSSDIILPSGKIGVGTITPTAPLQVVNNQDAQTIARVDNNSAGTSAQSVLIAGNGTAAALVYMNGTSFAGTGVGVTQIANGASLLSSSAATGGLTLGATGASAPTRFVAGGAFAGQVQSTGNLNWGTTVDVPVSLLQVVSTTKGTIPMPKMTNTQRDAITGVDGLMVYNTTNKSMDVHNGTAWQTGWYRSSGFFGYGITPTSPLHISQSGAGFNVIANFNNPGDPGNGATRLTVGNSVSGFLLQGYGTLATGNLASAASMVATSGTKYLIGANTGMGIEMYANNLFNAPQLKITSGGAIGVTQLTPTALLHIGAGTATANTAPLKFTAGTLLTTPESGALGTNATNDLFYTNSSGRRAMVAMDAYIAATSTFAITNAHRTVDCTSGTFTATLPTASGIDGRVYVIKNSGAGIITIACTGGQTIDGAATQTLSLQYQAITVQSNGSNWIILSKAL